MRTGHLCEERKLVAGLPLRYGRKSGKLPKDSKYPTGEGRRGQFTMILAPDAESSGQALFAEFKKPITSGKNLVKEVHALAWAERIYANENEPVHYVTRESNCWGLVAIWINPDSPQQDMLEKTWTNLGELPDYCPHPSLRGFVSSDGQIQLSWPKPALSEFDFVLCTPTVPVPEAKDWSPKVVAEAMIEAARVPGKGIYFRETYDCDIRTADDDLILAELAALNASTRILPKSASKDDGNV